ncbi:MAG: hypothetical protein JSW07_04255, partial [bacterium]
ADSGTPPVVKELFKETEHVLEDDQANLDLLEDIFRDDELPDLSISEDFDSHLEEDTTGNLAEESGPVDQNYLFGEEFRTEENYEFESKELEGLDDDEVFALMSGDEEFNKPKMKSPLDIKKPDFRKERKLTEEPPQEIHKKPEQQMEPPVKKILEDVQEKTKPKFESPMDIPPTENQNGDEILHISEEPDISDTEDLQRKKEKIVTPTLGEIYAAQHQYAKAIGVYEILRKKDPDNELFKQKIEYLQKRLDESQAE